MSKRIGFGAGLAVVALLAAAPARAVDPWEGGPLGDDSAGSINALGHGSVQTHDLDQAGGANDVDWMVVPTLLRHSYEARLSDANQEYDWGACPTCAQFERVSSAGGILTDDVSTVNEGGVEAYVRSVRWISGNNATNEYIRVTGDTNLTENASSVYTVRFFDTTYLVPRWNASGGQTTVFVISNVSQSPASGAVWFYNSSGSPITSVSFTLSQNQLTTISTAAVPALAGQSGHAHVVHTAGYGGLSGKAVALEPATGFTFDTVMTPIEQ
jgi:hypothetical protein